MITYKNVMLTEIILDKPHKLTKVWDVKSASSTKLGEIAWWNSWRRYCFFPEQGTLFDASCMWDVADFCSRMSDLQKEDQKVRREAKK